MREGGHYLVKLRSGTETVARWDTNTDLFYCPCGSQFGDDWCDVVRGPLPQDEAERTHAALFGDLGHLH